MYKFNNNTIVTGYIKQLLATFNLPNYRIYTKKQRKYAEEYGTELNVISTIKRRDDKTYPDHMRYIPYIKDSVIQYYVTNEAGEDPHWEADVNHVYYYNKPELNYTRNLQIKNNIYDYYTHEYLGDYLRFIRDYNNIDLMPLYNCFSDRICPSIDMEINGSKFDSSDSNYKIYMFPVKLFQQYTIAIDATDKPVEICCGLYDKTLDCRDKLKPIYKRTYKRYNTMKFKSPVLYTLLDSDHLAKTDITAMELAQVEKNLKMFIKIPVNNKSSITVLEGNYTKHNNNIYKIKFKLDDDGQKIVDTTGLPGSYLHSWDKITNKIVTNFANFGPDDEFNPITPLQLLMLNTGASYPFADRLVEYLVGNVITELDTCEDNIKRVHKVMQGNGYYFDEYGLWENKMRPILYDYINNHKNTTEVNHDILGYVDKDVEKYYSCKIKTDDTITTYTISGVDIYDESE